MLGGTIGNLDLGERRFLRGLGRLMGPRDLLLLDVPLAGPGWTPDGEPRLQAATYPESFRRFLAGGLRPAPSPAAIEDFVRAFSTRIRLALDDGRIPGARTITVVDPPTGRLLLRLTRYDWAATLDWLAARGWRVVAARCSLAAPTDRFGMGVVLAAAPDRGPAG
jgi:hypothetical protein